MTSLGLDSTANYDCAIYMLYVIYTLKMYIRWGYRIFGKYSVFGKKTNIRFSEYANTDNHHIPSNHPTGGRLLSRDRLSIPYDPSRDPDTTVRPFHKGLHIPAAYLVPGGRCWDAALAVQQQISRPKKAGWRDRTGTGRDTGMIRGDELATRYA